MFCVLLVATLAAADAYGQQRPSLVKVTLHMLLGAG